MPGVLWIFSYYSVEEGKLYCEFEAPSVELLREHASLPELPVDQCAVARELEPSTFP